MSDQPGTDPGAESVVRIGDSYYCMSPDALSAIKVLLIHLGYELTDLRPRLLERLTPEEVDVVPLALWSASLPVTECARCRSCRKIVSTAGLHTHAHRCEHCQNFLRHGEPGDPYVNYDRFRVFRGVEYPEHGTLPLPEYFDIYEAWRWARRQTSPKLADDLLHAVGLAARTNHFYDDETVLTPENLADMGRYLRYLTHLDADMWDEVSPTFPREGTAAILAVAKFCHPHSQLYP